MSVIAITEFTMPVHALTHSTVALDLTGSFLAVGDARGHISVFNTREPATRPLLSLSLPNKVTCIHWHKSPPSYRLAIFCGLAHGLVAYVEFGTVEGVSQSYFMSYHA